METAFEKKLLTVEGFSFSYPRSEKKTLNEISLTVGKGDFVVLCGPSGCGKTTLLRSCKPQLAPHGEKSGKILFDGTPLEELSLRDAAGKVGFVCQNPESQIVTDRVWHELAFGLESLGLDTPTIRLRTAETASFFGIEKWFSRDVSELSGGQKQLLTLASVMVMQPSLLILDEPTAQLDPIAASEFFGAVAKINRELGVTVLMTEHRLEEALPLCTKAAVMENGKIICDGTASKVGEILRESGHKMFFSMPAAMRIWAGVPNELPCPVTVRDGREWLGKMTVKNQIPDEKSEIRDRLPSVELEGVRFRYAKELPDVVKGFDFKAYPGEITAILGGNGTGKTTALSLISGLNKPYCGKVKISGENIEKIPKERLFSRLLGVLPQNPQTLFTEKTLLEDLLRSAGFRSKQEKEAAVLKTAELCSLTHLLGMHPYDLSGGEQQRAALAKVLLLEPKILLLDEPTKGFDADFKYGFASILRRLTASGATVVMVSHDIEFCAEYADRCLLFFDGGAVCENTPKKFFCSNSYYTTAANRIARHILPNAVTADDVIFALGGETSGRREFDGFSPPDEALFVSDGLEPKPEAQKKLPTARKISAGVSGLIFAVGAVFAALRFDGLKQFLSDESTNSNGAVWKYACLTAVLALSAIGFVFSLGLDRERGFNRQAPRRRLPKRTIAASVMILFLIPLTIFIGIYYLGDRKYAFISLLVIIEAMLPFALVFEGKKPQARELVLLAVLTAVAVAGRAAFFMLPSFKPVAAIVIIAGAALGGESGFLVGALTGFVSNLLFGQGPWTPWQMFAFGIIGFSAGLLFKSGVLRRSRAVLCVFGALAAFLIYGGLMNPASVLMYQAVPTKQLIIASYIQGLPFDIVHALSTAVFLALFSQPMLEKLERIKVKYGMLKIE